MVRIAIAGAAGRMGQQLIRAVAELDNAILSAALSLPNTPEIGQDAGVVAGLSPQDIIIQDTLPAADEFAVMVDFTHASATAANVAHIVATNRALVLGTTGYDDDVKAQIAEASKVVPILIASNYSLGVNVTMRLLEMAAKALGDVADIEVIESHHKHKVDAPSGTALSMGEVLAEATGKQLPDDGVYARVGQTGEREKGTIGFSTIRGGDVVGEHTVMFLMNGERVEITHRAMDRMVFARGAIKAAQWLADKPAGLYDMNDVLGLKV
jgi:4-hydroxy-tetrahydrodipicolinate reductase